MRVIFTSIVGTVHFTPLLPSAKEFQEPSHDVRFAARDGLEQEITDTDFRYVSVGRPRIAMTFRGRLN